MLRFRYDYECISQSDELVANGHFILDLPVYSIRSPDVKTKGYFGLIDHERELFKKYRGVNHLKTIRMKATNVFTKSVRYL